MEPSQPASPLPEQVEFDDLMARIREGDASALSTLLEQYEPVVRRVARGILGPQLRRFVDSIDIAQSVNLILMGSLRSEKIDLPTPDRLIALAVTLVRRRVSYHWRRMQRQQDVAGAADSSFDLLEHLASLQHPSEDPAALADMGDYIRQVLAELNPADRALVELRMQGLTTAEVGRKLGLDSAVLRVRLSRLRERLRAHPKLRDVL